eukprot:GHVH01016221.1.p1 GENE.GHVH01016221.1~~GHVH01016221.1.p1  ORF type:complete len:103 (+),score=2.35 GHVH01016221.1:53-361(+)
MLQRSSKVKMSVFWGKFFANNFLAINDRTFFDTIVFVSWRIDTYIMTFKGQFQNLTSGQGHMVTQVGHIAYESMRIDETDTLVPFSRFYLVSIKIYWQKNCL